MPTRTRTRHTNDPHGVIQVFSFPVPWYAYRHEHPNRSEAIRDLIREKLVRKGLGDDRDIAGAIVMTYDHHKRDLAERLMDVQHEFFANIISTQHVHLDHDSCLEIIAVRGKSRDIGLLASRLKAMIGVAHLEVSVSSYGLVGDEAESDGIGERDLDSDAHGHVGDPYAHGAGEQAHDGMHPHDVNHPHDHRHA